MSTEKRITRRTTSRNKTASKPPATKKSTKTPVPKKKSPKKQNANEAAPKANVSKKKPVMKVARKKLAIKKAAQSEATPVKKAKKKGGVSIQLEVRAKIGRTIRVVIARSGSIEHRDSVNTDRSQDLRKFRRDLAGKLKVEPAELAQLDDRIIRLADDADRRASEEATARQEANPIPYRRTESGLVYDKPLGDGSIPMQLTNFDAQIIEDVTEDDGVEDCRVFAIRGHLGNRVFEFQIPANRFQSMSWVNEHMGAEAVLHAGLGIKDLARVAIQLLSEGVVRRTVYKHTGWRRINDVWIYLHGGGAIGPAGPVPELEVSLSGELSRFTLPEVPRCEELRECVRQTLRLRRLAPRDVTCCLEGAAFRAALGVECDTTLWLTGETGSGKSELSARYQQHFGAAMNRTGLPGSWLSTGNSLEGSASAAKDALFTIDDFCPRGTASDMNRYNNTADRVIRAARNKAGRQRMWQDGNLRPTKVPRGIILGTGEDIPSGHSLRASMMIVELSREELDWDLLSECQQLGADGAYAKTMAGFVRFVARQYEELRDDIQQRLRCYRDQATSSASHQRTPDLVANLATGCWYFLQYAEDVGAITEEERQDYFDEAWAAIGEAARSQEQHQRSARPELRFLELLCSALGSEGYLADPKGQRPPGNDVAASYGWRQSESAGLHPSNWQPIGKRIGWIDGDDIYLDPEAAYKAAQEMARHSERIPIAEKTLHKRLSDSDLLASIDETRGRLTVRRQLEGKRRNVLHIKADVLCQE